MISISGIKLASLCHHCQFAYFQLIFIILAGRYVVS